MEFSHFRNEAEKASQYTKEGLDQLIEISRLLEGLDLAPSPSEKAKIIEGIIAKEKHAVSLIQQSTLMQRELMRKQHDAVAELIESI